MNTLTGPKPPELSEPQDPWAEHAPVEINDDQPDLATLSRDEEAAFNDIVANYHQEAPSGGLTTPSEGLLIKSHAHPSGERSTTPADYVPRHLNTAELNAAATPLPEAQDPWAERAPIDANGNAADSRQAEAATPPEAEKQGWRRGLLGRFAARFARRR